MLSDEAMKLLVRLDERAIYPDFIDAMPWRSDYDDWSTEVPEIDISSQAEPNSQLKVSDFFKSAKAKTVLDLMDDFCSQSWSKDFRNPPWEAPPFEFARLNLDNLHATPRTLEDSDQAAPYRLDSYFAKLLQKDESSFGNSIFAFKDMYMLTLMGFTCDQLVHLVDNPAAFREPTPGKRSIAIEKWIRRGALLALSRDFSDALIQKVEIAPSKAAPVPAFQQVAGNTTRIKRGLSVDNELPASEASEMFTQRYPGSRRGGSSIVDAMSSHGSTYGSDSAAGNGVTKEMIKVFANVTSELRSLNETHKEMNEVFFRCDGVAFSVSQSID